MQLSDSQAATILAWIQGVVAEGSARLDLHVDEVEPAWSDDRSIWLSALLTCTDAARQALAELGQEGGYGIEGIIQLAETDVPPIEPGRRSIADVTDALHDCTPPSTYCVASSPSDSPSCEALGVVYVEMDDGRLASLQLFEEPLFGDDETPLRFLLYVPA